ncbi:choice-of-anchor D domain-containing protein [Flavobacterium amnicola]|uniref:Choice-of-anchor D domain-containing protein n=1 Tax=Flavobacterium amnicola TaxID=2506422 RepID=A0A4Q1K011_9FLAO|nr:CUB domain-containing protein [Flavobacterium amnicola]RXR16278.1 choice-of-anchor D domain-containing protein [Flavobacterium amnicola]
MKKTLLLFALLFLSAKTTNAQNWEIKTNADFNPYFEEAYRMYPEIPRGILESVAYTNTHLKHIAPNPDHQSCIGLPNVFGVMGLIEDGKNYFRNNLKLVSTLSGFSEKEIKDVPRANILAYAKAYHNLLQRVDDKSIENQRVILNQLSELPDKNSYFLDSFFYSVLMNMNQPQFQAIHKIPNYNINFGKAFGKNLSILQSKSIKITNDKIETEDGKTYQQNKLMAPPCSDVSAGFPYTVLAAPADPGNYSSRSGTAITHATIHTMQGTYAGAISWFQNPSANVSAHYNIRASDGQITQSVCEIDKAWHVSNSNPYAIGIEHEGYIEDASWYTNNMYVVSAKLTEDMATRRGINLKRTYDKNGDSGTNPISDGCFKIKGHQHFPAQTHVDPGPFWDWNKYYDLLNPYAAATVNTYTTCSGTFYDSGGSAANYGSDERIFYLIKPTGAGTVSLNFSSLNLETNYDYLYVYDGESYNDPLIATLNGTTLPPTIVGTSGKLLLEFRTDCATVASGWTANWSCNTTAPLCEEPSALAESNLTHNTVRFDWADVATATSYEIRYKHALNATWDTFTTTISQFDATGLASDGRYLWQVRAICNELNSSAWIGKEFIKTSSASNITTTTCTGRFTDTGEEIGGYRNNENYTFTIAPTGATSIKVTFDSFITEAGFDFLRIYDGPTTASTLLGTYSGTTLPPVINASGGSLTFRFTSDNSTTKAGWSANWTCCDAKEINVTGNSTNILYNSMTPSTTNNTDFGTVSVNTSKTYKIQNTGPTALSIKNISISGTDASRFTLSGITLPAIVTAGEDLSFSILFNAGISGIKNATVTIDNDDCNETLYNYAIQATSSTLTTTDFENLANINVYSKDNFIHIDSDSEIIASVRVFDILGRKWYGNDNVNTKNFKTTLVSQKNILLVLVKTESGRSKTVKIIH